MDLIRELLLKLESLPPVPDGIYVLTGKELPIGEYSVDEIDYHLQLLKDAGFIESPQSPFGIAFRHLTWTGHDFLDSVRDPETWKKAKEGARKIGNWSLEILVSVAKAYAKHLAKERLGFDLS
jgi:hypothetical protein